MTYLNDVLMLGSQCRETVAPIATLPGYCAHTVYSHGTGLEAATDGFLFVTPTRKLAARFAAQHGSSD